jgi:hypothetical protein
MRPIVFLDEPCGFGGCVRYEPQLLFTRADARGRLPDLPELDSALSEHGVTGCFLKTSASTICQYASTTAGSDAETLLVASISGPNPDSVDVRLIMR